LQIVLNRYKPATLLFDDKHVERALTRPTQWKIPDDWNSARRTQMTATPLALDDSQISLAIRQMARLACGLPAASEEKKSLFSFFKSRWAPDLCPCLTPSTTAGAILTAVFWS
jgi:pilus assembly protein CpaE